MSEAKFDINPHVIKQLGNELVSDHVTALMELIKNAYDADASYVSVVIDTESKPCNDAHYTDEIGFITVEDDGFGMSKATIEKSWLIISYSNKRGVDGVKPKTPKGRTPLGDKGLGRLSTQRLADVCEIITKEEGKTAQHASFDWRDFDKVDKLQDVEVRIEACKIQKPKGTKLILSGLRGKGYWKDSNLERFKGLICQLISPYQENRPFDVYLTVNGEVIDFNAAQAKLNKTSIVNVEFRYSSQRLEWKADIQKGLLLGNDTIENFSKFILEDSGNNFINNFLQRKKAQGFARGKNGVWLTISQEFVLQDVIKINEDEGTPDPGEFFGLIRNFNFKSQQFQTADWSGLYDSFDAYKSFVQAQTGIKVYRNGFAVRPYGINGEDWLKLGGGQTSGSSFYGMRPENVIGYVAIDEEKNKNLKDKTDREGFVDNNYYFAFKALMEYLRDRINEKLEILRRYYNEYKRSVQPENTTIRTVTDAFSAIEAQVKRGVAAVNKHNEISKKVAKIEKEVEEVSSQQQMDLFVDANLVRQIDELKKATYEVTSILKDADNFLLETELLSRAIDVLRPKIESLETQLLDFTELASLGLVSEMVSHDLGQIANRMMDRANELDTKIKKDQIEKSDILKAIIFIKSSVSSLRKQMKHLDSSMKYRREKVETYSVANVIRTEELKYYEEKLKKRNIDIELVETKDFSVNINHGRLVQVLDNLMNNSIYWLEDRARQLTETPKITIEVDSPWIYFEDNGVGIDSNVEGTLFEPFVTRKPAGKGRGLGLFIITQLLDNIGCHISLDESRNQYGNLFRFRINMHEIIKK